MGLLWVTGDDRVNRDETTETRVVFPCAQVGQAGGVGVPAEEALLVGPSGRCLAAGITERILTTLFICGDIVTDGQA